MVFENFKTTLKKLIKERGYEIREHSVTKVNQVLNGFSFVTDKNEKVQTVFYFEYLYNDFLNNNATVESILNEVLATYENKADKVTEIENKLNEHSLLDFNEVKSKIFCSVVNTEQNEKLLEHIPHIDMLDLSLIFTVDIFNGQKEDYYLVTITNAILEEWNISIQDLYELALNNNENMFGKVFIKSMYDLFKDDFGLDMPPIDILPCENLPYVFSNNKKNYGANNLFLYRELLKEFSNGMNIIILPSSRHELLLLPTSDDMQDIDFNGYREMVTEVNKNEVSERDFLSDNVYFYCNLDDEIKIA